MEAIFKRRSIRKYTDKKVEIEKIEKLLKAAMQAPSAGNQQPWEFMVIENQEILKKLAMMSPYSKMIGDAPVAFVLLGNKERMRFQENWEQDMGACTQNILLEAVELELGTVWLGVAPLEDRMKYVKEILDLEDNLTPYCIIPVGYPGEGQFNEFVDRYDESRVTYKK